MGRPRENRYKKGQAFEQQVSFHFHSDSMAILVSSKLLRCYGGGQIDVAWIFECSNFKKHFFLLECKSCRYGVVTLQQKKRLQNSFLLLNSWLEMEGSLKILISQGRNDENIFTMGTDL